MGYTVFTTSCNFLKHSKFIWAMNVTSGKKAEICELHPAHAKTTVAQGKAVALKCLSIVGLFCVPTHNLLPSEKKTTSTPTQEQGLTLNHTVMTFPQGWEERVSVLSVGPRWEKLLLAASTNYLPLCSCLASHSKSRQGCSAITWLTWKHSKH